GGGFERLNPRLLRERELIHQGESAERIAERWKITREDADSLSAESHRRAGARKEYPEILPTRGLDPEGNEIELASDEGVRHSVDPQKMAQLPP
ncbi:hypothetical protein LMF94_23160, partial [Salmonella enterica subsp. enterica serovar Muenster]|nr:hypothetical protein [Salmonella enterica subsp. enterica serovar Muenster]